MRAVLVCAVTAGLLLARPGAATADCIGPEIRIAVATAARGELVDVFGTGWGDNCYDTGPPPPGEGVLGRPIRGIEVAFVQRDHAVVVARGDADERYGFDLRVAVPAALRPGPAEIIARSVRHGEAFEVTTGAFTVTDTTPAPATDELVTFGPPAAPATTATTSDHPVDERRSNDRGTAVATGIVTAAAVVTMGLVAATRVRRARCRRTTGGRRAATDVSTTRRR